VAQPGGLPETKTESSGRAGKVINKYKIAKHFIVTIHDRYLGWTRKEAAIQKEAILDSIYVVRTSEPTKRLSATNGVRSYRRSTLVEQAFRCLKGIDLLVRPI
jgi:hypothetical protein